MNKLIWYKNRLVTMSILEIPYRIKQLFKKQFDRLQIGKKLIRKNYESKRILNVQLDSDVVGLFDKRINIFGKELDYSQTEINWHLDIFSLNEFSKKYSKSINIRSNKNLSAKNVWEINRLQFLPQLAVNYRLTNDEKILREFITINKSWIESNPYLIGINWYSNIEVNLRLINWFLAWEILEVENIHFDWFKCFVEEYWIPLIHQHCVYSFSNPSKFSSANNHLISEYAGLFIASSKWKFTESNKWNRYAKNGLEKEIIKQHSNGINREEAAEYIQFITDFFLLSYVVAKNSENDFSIEYSDTLRQIFDYINNFLDISGNFPKYGDEDDGKVMSLSNQLHNDNFHSILTSGAILFNEQKYLSRNKEFDLKNQILFGAKGLEVLTSLKGIKRMEGSIFYKDQGHFIFRKQWESKEIYLHFDAAPLGYLSIAAHGHADALSFVMNVNGFPIFVDPGTFSYHIEPEWRSYFVSTQAHNTVCIDNQNQSYHAADTMWLKHFNCNVHEIEMNGNSESVTASHNGYKHLLHTRKISFDREECTFEIIDTLMSKDKRNHIAQLNFHLHPHIDCKLVGHTCTLTHHSGIKVELHFQEFGELTLHEGELDPILGWYSESFMKRHPTKVIVQKFEFQQVIQIKSKIKIYEY
jgi:hypothetical protein